MSRGWYYTRYLNQIDTMRKREKLSNRPMIVDRARVLYTGERGHVVGNCYTIIGFYILYILGKSGFKKGTRMPNINSWHVFHHKRHNDIKATLIDQDVITHSTYPKSRVALTEDVRKMYSKTVLRDIREGVASNTEIEAFIVRWFREHRDIEVQFINEYQ